MFVKVTCDGGLETLYECQRVRISSTCCTMESNDGTIIELEVQSKDRIFVMNNDGQTIDSKYIS